MDSLHIELEGPELQARGGRAVASQEDLHAYVTKLVRRPQGQCNFSMKSCRLILILVAWSMLSMDVHAATAIRRTPLGR